jgi:hypothetical protein
VAELFHDILINAPSSLTNPTDTESLSLDTIPLVLQSVSSPASSTPILKLQDTYDTPIFIARIHHLRHGQYSRHSARNIKPGLVEMVHALDVLEDEGAGADCFVPDLFNR